jgi:hypothetical protein
MADPFSIGGGIVSVIGLAIQVTQVVVQLGLDWKDAPADVKMFMAELQGPPCWILPGNRREHILDHTVTDSCEGNLTRAKAAGVCLPRPKREPQDPAANWKRCNVAASRDAAIFRTVTTT